jgi:hypothetical protein
MRLWSKRRLIAATEPSGLVEVHDVEVDVPPPVPWTIDQLNALGPVTGPNHRTFVPIVRSALLDTSLGDLTQVETI